MGRIGLIPSPAHLFCYGVKSSFAEAGNLKSVNGVCATILDSSLRCAAFRMTGKGRCVQNDRIDLLLRCKTLCVSNVNRTYSLLPLMSPNTKDSAEEPTVHKASYGIQTVIAVWLAGLASTYTESATAPTRDRVATTMANPTTTIKIHAPERGSVVTLEPHFSSAVVNPDWLTRMAQGRPHYPQRGNRPCDEWMARWFQGGGSRVRIGYQVALWTSASGGHLSWRV